MAQQHLQQAWQTWLLCRWGLATESSGQSCRRSSRAGPSMCGLDLTNMVWSTAAQVEATWKMQSWRNVQGKR